MEHRFSTRGHPSRRLGAAHARRRTLAAGIRLSRRRRRPGAGLREPCLARLQNLAFARSMLTSLRRAPIRRRRFGRGCARQQAQRVFHRCERANRADRSGRAELLSEIGASPAIVRAGRKGLESRSWPPMCLSRKGPENRVLPDQGTSSVRFSRGAAEETGRGNAVATRGDFSCVPDLAVGRDSNVSNSRAAR